jgi:hypothetical protein
VHATCTKKFDFRPGFAIVSVERHDLGFHPAVHEILTCELIRRCLTRTPRATYYNMSVSKDRGLAQVMQVFISSASKEMAAYRDQAIKAIKSVGMVHTNYNDPKGAGFTQGARSIFEMNQNTVKHCDVFVGLYGFGGVWRPASHPGLVKLHPELLKDPDKLIMEYEYEWAQEGGLYLFRFMRTNETEEAFAPMDERMDSFRVDLMTNAVGWLSTPSDFCDHLTESLRGIRPRIFLSYSRRNKEYASQLQQQLRSQDLHAWRDETNIPGSAEWAAVIEAAIERMDALVVIVTPESAVSEWVEKECTAFLRNRKPIIPYISDPSIKSKLPKYLSPIMYIDGTVSGGLPALVKQLRVLLSMQPDA